MNVDILYITYNRVECTQKTLSQLLSHSGYPFNLTIVDNGSTDSTVEFLKEITGSFKDRFNIKLILNKNNEGLSSPTNKFWESSGAELVGKIDNDIFVEENWLQKLVCAHEKINRLAVIGGCHFPIKLFNEKKIKHNIFEYSDVKVLRQPHIGGNYLAKKEVLLANGRLQEPSPDDTFKLGGWTEFQHRLADQDYIIGYHYPMVVFDHIYTVEDDYYKKVRGMSGRKYMKWEKNDGKKLLYTKWKWNTNIKV